MARGRFLNNTICRDKEVNDLSSDTCRLLFTWLISHADREGRTHGDPALVKSMVFPRRSDISIEQVDTYLDELHAAGLILRYEANGDKFILFPAFEKNQVGMRKDREPESDLPKTSDGDIQEYIRKFAGKKPEVCRIIGGLILIGIEEEVNTNVPPKVNLPLLYEKEIGRITAFIADEIRDAEKEYPAEWFPMAIQEAVTNNVRKWKYVKAILEDWKTNGVKTRKNGNGSKPKTVIKYGPNGEQIEVPA